MFEQLKSAPGDPILGLMEIFRNDPRENKVDLGVGVYKDPAGLTPIPRAVKLAEKILFDDQNTKTYVGLVGRHGFNRAMMNMVLGPDIDQSNWRACQAPGGSGAIRLLTELIAMARPGSRIYLPDPTWGNHIPLAASVGLMPETYPYYDGSTGTVDFEAMCATLKSATAGSVVLLHGCCHNPTGADLSLAQWQALTELMSDRDLFPFIDLAYQGFGDGLDQDAAGLREMVARLPEAVVAVSCSKTFGLYRERTGAALVKAKSADKVDAALSQMGIISRRSYSMSPDHGAAIVETILESNELRPLWNAELTDMRERIQRLRAGLAEALKLRSNSSKFDFLTQQKGMFSRLGISQSAVRQLREANGIYMIDDSRINIAGLPEGNLAMIADSILQVTEK